ncbi:UNKNOWN [Stylonychia lemnae]|uniref:Uncharacterized protein n=1 Tax=Stylonychia lemnae TaxID=5949 RepID=A0A078BA11_STYLE|nr:UNKNOWN [Stylonychia lemnae]|eukprot:CDW91076.1 UNKNOWN [Stylonychia lemnae]
MYFFLLIVSIEQNIVNSHQFVAEEKSAVYQVESDEFESVKVFTLHFQKYLLKFLNMNQSQQLQLKQHFQQQFDQIEILKKKLNLISKQLSVVEQRQIADDKARKQLEEERTELCNQNSILVIEKNALKNEIIELKVRFRELNQKFVQQTEKEMQQEKNLMSLQEQIICINQERNKTISILFEHYLQSHCQEETIIIEKSLNEIIAQRDIVAELKIKTAKDQEDKIWEHHLEMKPPIHKNQGGWFMKLKEFIKLYF